MTFIHQMPVMSKLWHFLRTYVLTLARFDLFLQGALLIVILLEHNVYILLNRDTETGYTTPLMEDWVLIGAAAVEFLLGAMVAWWGRGKRNFALSAWLAAAATCGLLVLAFPFNRPNPQVVELCGGNPISALNVEESDPLATPRTVVLVICAVVCGLTKVSIWAHGFSYLDDHDTASGPYYCGILISINLSLGMSGQNWLRPGANRDDWWQAHLSISMLTLMFAILFALFPRRMNKDLIEEDVDDGFFSMLTRIVTNKVLVLQVGALGFINSSLYGFFHYDRRYIEARYHIEAVREDLRSARLVGNIFRPFVVIFFIMIFRMRFSIRRAEGVKATTAARVGGVVSVLVAAFFLVVAFLDCGAGDLAGMDSGVYVQPECSQQCGCTPVRSGFAPICTLESTTTYFSPCNVGCRQYDNLNGFLVFSNCTCSVGAVTRGACTQPSCRLVYSLYQVIATIILALAGASMMMQVMVFVRAVWRPDKAMAVGGMMAAVALLAHVFGHLLYMLISYLTCAFSHNGTCVFHQPSIYSMALVSAALALCSAVASVFASKLARKTSGELGENIVMR